MARSQLTETINRVAGMVTYVRDNLSVEEYDLFLDMVAPQPEPELAAKKTRKKRATKSTRASGMAAAIKNSLEQGKQAAADDAPKPNGQPCTAIVPGLDVVCGETADRLIHDPNGGYGGYHPFDAPAQPAEKRSKKKAAAANSGASSETSMDAAISVSGD